MYTLLSSFTILYPGEFIVRGLRLRSMKAIILCSFVLTVSVRAAVIPAGTGDSTRLDSHYLAGILHDTGRITVSPLHWSGGDYLTAGGLLLAGTALYTRDSRIRDRAQRWRGGFSDDISRAVKPFGDGRYTLPALGALYLYGRLGSDFKASGTALLGVESFAVAGLFTGALKDLAHRHRPSSGDPYDSWDGPALSVENQSFPSGHSSAAFAVMTVIAKQYGNHRWVPPLAYGIATLTALSRVNDNAHWSSDVLFGSAIGFFTARAVLHCHELHVHGAGLSLMPPSDFHKLGLGMTLAD